MQDVEYVQPKKMGIWTGVILIFILIALAIVLSAVGQSWGVNIAS